ncbi:MAG: M23 family metallopeptidase [Acidimicrobiales bacterium]|nr:M23 family metallopeptidase [Acidimicrobiales bacterium]
MPTTPRGRNAARVGLGATLLLTLVISAVFLVGAGAADAQESGPPAADASEAGTAMADPTPSSDGLAGLQAIAATAAERATATASVLAEAATPPPPPPVYCPAPGSQFINSWGFSRSGGRSHKGVDMMAPYGTPVLAPVDGVVRPSNSSLGGIGFYLDDADGNVYFGSHLSTLDVTGPVVAGQQIGTVGSTGNAGTPHLHFEVKPAGMGSVNPFPFAFNWCTTDFTQADAVALLP